MANRKALSSSRQAMNAVQPISTYEVLELTVLSVLVTKLRTTEDIPFEGFGTVLSVLVTKQVRKRINET